MNEQAFLEQLSTNPESIQFDACMEMIDAHYTFQECAFKNGDLLNAAGQNNGSCKVFAFGLRHQLSESQILHCFGDYYRKDVLEHPEGNDHQNIRNFIRQGWAGIAFEGEALIAKPVKV